MTINGPAPMLLGYFMNAAIDQQCEKYIHEHELEHLVEAKFKEVYDDKGLERPKYQSLHPGPLQRRWCEEFNGRVRLKAKSLKGLVMKLLI